MQRAGGRSLEPTYEGLKPRRRRALHDDGHRFGAYL